MNKQRERLVELIGSKVCEEYSPSCDEYEPHTCEKCYANFCKVGDLAEAIIADGWMRPPVKVGQSLWHIEEYTHKLLPSKYPTVKVVCESKVEKIFIEKYGNSFGDTRKSFSFHDIGKTVFLAKEEAEQALNNVQNGNSCEGGVQE